MSQSKKHSVIEAVVNVVLGMAINLTAQSIIFPAIGLAVTLGQNAIITAFFTGISLTRSYCLRRLFNRVTERSHTQAEPPPSR